MIQRQNEEKGGRCGHYELQVYIHIQRKQCIALNFPTNKMSDVIKGEIRMEFRSEYHHRLADSGCQKNSLHVETKALKSPALSCIQIAGDQSLVWYFGRKLRID